MLEWLRWLLDATPFRTPMACGGWGQALVVTTILGNILIFLIYTTIPLLLLLFLRTTREPWFFRQRLFSFSFAAFIFACGLTHLLRATSFFWPAYRLQSGVTLAAALISWATVALMVPVAMKHENRRLHEERHAFANQVNCAEMKNAVQVARMETLLTSLGQREADLTVIAERLDRLSPLLARPEHPA